MELQEAHIIAKATALAGALKIQDFKHSHGWFQNFTRRFGYRSYKLHGEANAADVAGVELARDLVPKLIEAEV